MKLQKVTQAVPLGGYRLQVTFDDGFSAPIDLQPVLQDGPIFEPLQDVAFFQSVFVEKYGVIAWPNEADICSDSLRAWCEAGQVLDARATGDWITNSRPLAA